MDNFLSLVKYTSLAGAFTSFCLLASVTLQCYNIQCSCSKHPLFFPPIGLVVGISLCLTCFPASWTYCGVWGGWSHPAPFISIADVLQKCILSTVSCCIKQMIFHSGFVSSKYLSFTLPLGCSFSSAYLPGRILLPNH